MEQMINNQLEIIKSAIKWTAGTSSMEGSKGKNAYRNLVNFRRKLSKKRFALEGNPAAAMYGESQVGKSYLIGSLLSEQGTPFSITGNSGVVHDFIGDINPPGGGSESTSLVSRFSIKYAPSNLKFPIKAKLLSIADLVLMLCDSFYNDIKVQHDQILKREDIDARVTELKETWRDRSVQQQVICEDDVLNIQDYFKNNFSAKAGNIPESFFEDMSLLITKIKPSEWKDAFCLLWNRNENFTDLFSNLIKEYQKLNFADAVYLPMEAVLSKNTTLLDVKCLKEIYDHGQKTEYKADTAVLFWENNSEKEISSFSKSYLCALAAELVFSLPGTLSQSKPFLNTTDLLDLPGIRARKTVPEDMINETEIPDLLIRGKVAYLFNKYIEAEKINILLFCAKHEQAAQRAMPELLNNYVNKIIGGSPEEREAYIKSTKLPPLFIISTFFNMNMAFDPFHDKEGDDSSLAYRWEQRFKRTLAKEMLNTEIYDWFEQWTISRPNFQNIFLLRDFTYSESKSNLFKGYIESRKELAEVATPTYPAFRKNLRQSFLDYDFVKQHFENPAEAWARAANINEDGTKLIIEKLTIVANNINEARRKKLVLELNAIAQGVLDELKKYFHDSDSDSQLQKAKSKAGGIQANLDIAFGQNPYFFGQMMKEFMLSERAVYDLYLEKIRDIERRDVVNMDKYSAIRMNVSGLDPSDSFENNLERLRLHYEKETKAECAAYFEAQKIDLEELFYGNNERVKNFSQVLADALEEFWFEQYMGKNRQSLSKIFLESGLQDIQDMLRQLFKKQRISQVIAGKIRQHVDGYRNIEDAYDMIADFSAEIINKFINTIGLEYLTQAELNDLKQANEKNSLGLILEHKDLQFEQNTPAEAADLITKMGNLPELLNQNPLPQDARRLPNYRNYILWYDLLKVGFVSVCHIPNYDVQANKELKVIIDQSNAIKY
jgi:hypothetical protein